MGDGCMSTAAAEFAVPYIAEDASCVAHSFDCSVFFPAVLVFY
jgi:hypothetical protein